MFRLFDVVLLLEVIVVVVVMMENRFTELGLLSIIDGYVCISQLSVVGCEGGN